MSRRDPLPRVRNGFGPLMPARIAKIASGGGDVRGAGGGIALRVDVVEVVFLRRRPAAGFSAAWANA